ncbi:MULTISPECIES: NAD-dependent epimerase/dehydratase family protein [unclassified Undibacterium]|uniref:NAD-dependent epimerase/dehydratase family protein n=1 Tax=unclassified Undibacterium TaxID=2630295 RepID=UPI001331C5B8|nr:MULTISPECIES: NAD(P)-dependent oxidoreductase [unclassified Undibacterium]BBB58530.1 uronate dehydrogenase [Undibacterium sp. KW1]BBB64482.1 uronate dehydrogenase [Undibacterium sp. YM2]
MNTNITEKPFNRILLTGAAGGLGKVLRERIKAWANIVRLSDIADLGPAGEGEEVVQCDLADKAAVLALMEGVDVVLHFGGISTEANFEAIMHANIQGTYNIYEAVHKHNVKRVVFASSNHAVGFYRTTDYIDADMPTRPDGMYGISKCFGESLSRFYYDRFGIETVCIRIGSSFPVPTTRRMLVTYFSYDDLVEMLRCSIFAQRVGHTIAFGVSENPGKWWDNKKAAHLGYKAKDSSTVFSHLYPDSSEYPAKDDITTIYQGGGFLLTTPQYKD